jgi:hypothetical protein
MPNHKRRLSRAKEAKYLACLQELRAGGQDLEIPEEWLQHSRALDVVLAGPEKSTVFETPNGGVVYALYTRWVALRPGVTVTEWDVCTRYDDQIVSESFDDRIPLCKLGGQEFLKREVLNQRIENGLRLVRGEVVEGWLLATGLRPIPAEYRDFAIVPFEIVITDSLRHEYRADATLSVLRRARQCRPGVRRGTGLNGWSATPIPTAPSIGEESRLRYLKMKAEEKSRQESTISSDSKCRGAIPGHADLPKP